MAGQVETARHRDVPRTSNEYVAGMEVFYTPTPPLGGRLRQFPEDFVVEELGRPPREDPQGKHLALRVRLTNWEHNAFIRDASRKVGIGRNGVGFAGTKDKRAVTTQWFTFLADRLSDEQVLERLGNLPRVEVLTHHRTTKGLRLGMHDGNRFRITIRGIEGERDEVQGRLDTALGALDAMNGFPNFFGIQRFGATRPITHLVGESIVRGDLEEAVVRYVTAAATKEGAEAAAARATIQQNRDWKEAQQLLPADLKFERAVVHHLTSDPTDFRGALRNLPANLVLLFVHAYQSYLYNRMLSERIRRGLPLHRPVVGDLVLPLASGSLIDVAPVRVTAGSLAKIERQIRKGRAVVSLPLVGYTTPLATDEPGEIERAILESEDIDPQRFRHPPLREAESKGLRRAVLTPASDLAAVVSEDQAEAGMLAAEVSFSLTKGSYATTLLREILKAEDTTVY